jgi:hypothetical protein
MSKSEKGIVFTKIASVLILISALVILGFTIIISVIVTNFIGQNLDVHDIFLRKFAPLVGILGSIDSILGFIIGISGLKVHISGLTARLSQFVSFSFKKLIAGMILTAILEILFVIVILSVSLEYPISFFFIIIISIPPILALIFSVLSKKELR